MGEIVMDKFRELIKELKEEGWNDDIIDETNLLFKKYRMEKINDD